MTMASSTSHLLHLISVIVLCGFVGRLTASQKGKQPHIIFIVADDLGWNDVGWHNPEVLTPNLDRLAKTGVKLEASYVQSTCSPSRNSFMTGYFPFHTELQSAVDPAEPTFLPLKYPTIADRLKEQGYATHVVGKWHLGFCNEKYIPTSRGFDSFFGFYGGSQCHYTHRKADKIVQRVSSKADISSFGHVVMSSFLSLRTEGTTMGRDFRFNTTVWRKTEMTYSTHAFTHRAVEIIERHDPATPLYLYLAFSAPHSPIQVPGRYEQLYSHIEDTYRRIYLGMVSAIDEAVGKITDSLYQNGLMDNLLLVFTSDNGGYPFMGGNNLPLRGSKNTFWEGGTRVPTFAFSPTLLRKKGIVSNGLFHATDWFPTFIKLAGGDPDPGIDGINQWAHISRGATSPRSEFVYNIDPSGKGALRSGHYKLIVGKPGMYNDWYPDQSTGKVSRRRYRGGRNDENPALKLPYMLFNITADPNEEQNIAEESPDLLATLLARYSVLNGTKVAPHQPERSPQAAPELYNGFWSPGWC